MNDRPLPDNVNNFQLRYVGARFDGARLPVDVLGDLPAFRDLIVSFVKKGWYAQHTDKVRLPKGFDSGLSFDLVALTEGSAIPNLNWNRTRAQECLPGILGQLDDLMNSSFASFMHLVDNAEMDDIPDALSTQQVRALNKLGAGLRDDERIEFLNTKSSQGGFIYLDNERRKRLITRVKGTYETRANGVGTLSQVKVVPDEDAGSISIFTEKYGEIEIKLDRSSVMNWYAPNLGSEIQYDLQIEVDRNDQVRNVVEIYDIGVIDVDRSAELSRCRERITQLSALEEDWDGDGAQPISVAAKGAAIDFINRRSSWCHLFKIFPSDDSGLSFEFEYAGWDYTVEFLHDGSIEMFGIEVHGDGTLKPIRYESVDQIFLTEFDNRIGAK